MSKLWQHSIGCSNFPVRTMGRANFELWLACFPMTLMHTNVLAVFEIQDTLIHLNVKHSQILQLKAALHLMQQKKTKIKMTSF